MEGMSDGEKQKLSDGRQWIFPLDSKVDVVFADGAHRYWSTHCRHGRHDACSAVEIAPGVPRRPAQCETCSAPCWCLCHRQPVQPEVIAYVHTDSDGRQHVFAPEEITIVRETEVDQHG